MPRRAYDETPRYPTSSYLPALLHDYTMAVARSQGRTTNDLLLEIVRHFVACRPWERGMPFTEQAKRSDGHSKASVHRGPVVNGRWDHHKQITLRTDLEECEAIRDLVEALAPFVNQPLGLKNFIETAIMWWIWIIKPPRPVMRQRRAAGLPDTEVDRAINAVITNRTIIDAAAEIAERSVVSHRRDQPAGQQPTHH